MVFSFRDEGIASKKSRRRFLSPGLGCQWRNSEGSRKDDNDDPFTPWSKYMAQSPKGRLIQGLYMNHYEPIHGNCAIYFYPGVNPWNARSFFRKNNFKMCFFRGAKGLKPFFSPCGLKWSCFFLETERSLWYADVLRVFREIWSLKISKLCRLGGRWYAMFIYWFRSWD